MTYRDLNDDSDTRDKRLSRDEQSRRYLITQTPKYQALEKRKAELREAFKPLNKESREYEVSQLHSYANIKYEGRPVEQLRKDIIAIKTEYQEIVKKQNEMLAPPPKPKKQVPIPQPRIDLGESFRRQGKQCPQCGDLVSVEAPICKRCKHQFDPEACKKLCTDSGAAMPNADKPKDSKGSFRKEVEEVSKPIKKSDYEEKVYEGKELHKDIGNGFATQEAVQGTVPITDSKGKVHNIPKAAYDETMKQVNAWIKMQTTAISQEERDRKRNMILGIG